MKLYKLTRQDFTSRNDTLWGENVTHEVYGEGTELCSSDVIHAYLLPELAVLLNYLHIDYENPVLWEAEGDIVVNDGIKIGCKKLTTIKQIPLPDINTVQKISFAILCVLEVCHQSIDNDFVTWANKWFSGEDRNYKSILKFYFFYDPFNISRISGYDEPECYAYSVASVVQRVNTFKKLDLVSLVKKAMEY